MSSASDDDDDGVLSDELEEELMDAGLDLLNNCSSCTVDELLIFIEKVDSGLAKVGQLLPKNASALVPIMTALLTNEVLRHTDVNIQIAVASCMNELIRITAPEAPYDVEFMEVIFPLFMVVFKQLSSESADDYAIPLRILETMAAVKSCLLMIDISNELVVEMFQLFLNTIRPDHPTDTFKYMKIIMTMVIEESDVLVELLKPLLLSARLDNKNMSPVSWKLAKTVIEKCARKLQPYVRVAMQSMNVDIDDYPEIVISLCQDTSRGRKRLEKEASLTFSKISRLSKGEQEVCAPDINDSTENISDDRNLSHTSSSDSEETHVAEIDKPVMDKGTIQRKRGRKPTHMSQDEGYKHFLPGESSRKERSSVNVVGLHKKGPSQKGIVINEDNNQEWSSSIRRKILKTKVKMRGSSATKKGKRIIAGSSYTGVEEEEEILSNNAREGKLEFLRDEQRKKKKSLTLQKQESNNVGNKMVGSSSGKPPKTKYQKNLSQEKGKKPRRSLVDSGEELIKSRIQVWWPMDKIFYKGTVEAFDPMTRKHTILYDDNELETLNLEEERWQLLNDKLPQEAQSSQKEEADHPSPAKEPVKSQEKTAKQKRKMGSSSKQHAASLSSKRLKNESRGVVISGQSSARNVVGVTNESEETRETNVSAKDDGENHAGKEEVGTSRDQSEQDVANDITTNASRDQSERDVTNDTTTKPSGDQSERDVTNDITTNA